MNIKVAILEDDSELRGSLMKLFSCSKGFSCLHSFSTAAEAIRGIQSKPPDVLIADIHLHGISGIECVSKLQTVAPAVLCVMLTVVNDGNQIFEALRAGASGYLVKGTSPAEILAAIKDVYRGGSPMSSAIARKVVRYFTTDRNASLSSRLTPREFQILKHLAEGHRYKEIAGELSISEFTVRNHLRKIYEKLHVTSRTEAVVKYLSQNS